MNSSRAEVLVDLPNDWRAELQAELEAAYFTELSHFVDEERRKGHVYPDEDKVFRAFKMTSLTDTRVLLLGQDPYHGEGQAQGLCFSVPKDGQLPPSLKNIFKELQADLGVAPPTHGDLSGWAKQGVLLLNAVLTVRAGQAGSHRSRGWEHFTDAVISALARRQKPLVFVLWGNYARKKAKLVHPPHLTLQGVHPSPLSASRGFFGSRPFSKINSMLADLGQPPIDWTARVM